MPIDLHITWDTNLNLEQSLEHVKEAVNHLKEEEVREITQSLETKLGRSIKGYLYLVRGADGHLTLERKTWIQMLFLNDRNKNKVSTAIVETLAQRTNRTIDNLDLYCDAHGNYTGRKLTKDWILAFVQKPEGLDNSQEKIASERSSPSSSLLGSALREPLLGEGSSRPSYTEPPPAPGESALMGKFSTEDKPPVDLSKSHENHPPQIPNGEKYQRSPQDIILKESIGQGVSATVHNATFAGQSYAYKKLNKKDYHLIKLTPEGKLARESEVTASYFDKTIQKRTLAPSHYVVWNSTNEKYYIFPANKEFRLWARDCLQKAPGSLQIQGLLMKKAEGVPLNNLLKDQEKTKTNCDCICDELLTALWENSWNGFTHADLKPANILFETSNIGTQTPPLTIIDTGGVAKISQKPERLKETVVNLEKTTALFTPAYSNPASCTNPDGNGIGYEQDLYSTAITMFAMYGIITRGASHRNNQDFIKRIGDYFEMQWRSYNFCYKKNPNRRPSRETIESFLQKAICDSFPPPKSATEQKLWNLAQACLKESLELVDYKTGKGCYARETYRASINKIRAKFGFPIHPAPKRSARVLPLITPLHSAQT